MQRRLSLRPQTKPAATTVARDLLPDGAERITLAPRFGMLRTAIDPSAMSRTGLARASVFPDTCHQEAR